MNTVKEHFKNRKAVRIILPVLLIAAALISFFLVANNKTYIGEVEATVLSHTSEVSGKILEMPVELGQHVKKGDAIAVIDSSTQDYAYEQLEITLAKKKLALSELQIGGSAGDSTQAENSVSIAKANYNSASSAYNKANQDYQNALKLYQEGAISKDALDSAKLKADSASSALTVAKAQLDTAYNETSADSMQLDIEQTESQLKQMKETLDKYTIKASCDGIVMSKSYLIGDMVAPGYNLVDISSDQEKYFVFYYPKEDLSDLKYNQVISVKLDKKSYDGTVKYMDVESEYTPKDMQTTANKNKDSIKIKLLLPSDCPLSPGVQGEVKISDS